MSGNDPTEGLALMVKRFKKTVETVKTCIMHSKSAKIFFVTGCNLVPHSITVSGDLELQTPVVVVAPPQLRVKFCPSSPGKKTLILSTTEDACIPSTYP
jgi:hypothetical protein